MLCQIIKVKPLRYYFSTNSLIYVSKQNLTIHLICLLQLQLNEDNTKTAEAIKAKNKDNSNSSRTESPITEITSQDSPELLIKHPLQVSIYFLYVEFIDFN